LALCLGKVDVVICPPALWMSTLSQSIEVASTADQDNRKPQQKH